MHPVVQLQKLDNEFIKNITGNINENKVIKIYLCELFIRILFTVYLCIINVNIFSQEI